MLSKSESVSGSLLDFLTNVHDYLVYHTTGQTTQVTHLPVSLTTWFMGPCHFFAITSDNTGHVI